MSPARATQRVVALYDRVGSFADFTAFYVDAAVDRLTELASMREAACIVEVGGGTGRYAERLLQHSLRADATYIDVEPSRRMRDLASARLDRWRNRVIIRDVGDMLEADGGTADRYVMTYVLNVLPDEDAIRQRLQHAHRTLGQGGLLCLVNQTFGQSITERLMSAAWMRMYRVAPTILGNCRLLSARPYVDDSRWRIVKGEIVRRFGVCSEVLVAAKR